MFAKINRYRTTSALQTIRLVLINQFHLTTYELQEKLPPTINFNINKEKSKNTYLEMINIYTDRNHVYRRGHVEFIYSALKHMDEYGVSKDLNVYKALIDVMPKGKFIPTNIFQAEFMHYPKQQQCIVDVLEQMEDNGVLPDVEMEQMLLNIFGNRGFPLRKYWRMMYWMPKFKYASPWYVPNPVPDDTLNLARLAIKRISSVDVQTIIKVYTTDDVKIWIVSAQSPTQKNLIQNHNESEPIYVMGPCKVWLRNKSVDYFYLNANPKSSPTSNIDEDPFYLDDISNIEVKLQNSLSLSTKSVHEQDDGVIMALCATQTSNKESLLCWIRHLEKDGNPMLGAISIVFRLKSSTVENKRCISVS
nr:evolutionarily conserved signaling intermediate in Toll pathway, mitochondrial-like [Onthophagus taurus]